MAFFRPEMQMTLDESEIVLGIFAVVFGTLASVMSADKKGRLAKIGSLGGQGTIAGGVALSLLGVAGKVF